MVYLKKYNLLKVKITKKDLINVVVIRNNLAKLHKKLKEQNDQYKNLPDLYTNISDCKNCYVREVCFLHYKNSETRSDDQISDLIWRCKELKVENNVLYDLDSNIVKYFNYYMDLINKEEVCTSKEEKNNIYKNNLSSNNDFDYDISTFDCFRIETVVENSNSYNLAIRELQNNFRNEDLNKNYEILNEGYHVYDSVNNKSYFAIVESREQNKDGFLVLNLSVLKKNIFKNKNYFSTIKEIYLKSIYSNAFSFKLMRGNLVNMILTQKSKVINDIVHLEVPKYTLNNKDYYIKFISNNFASDFRQLNDNQKHAILKSMLCEYYSLIVGYPGSGKTTIIALLIDILVRMGKKVLVATFTNTAVDNILIKLRERNFHKFKRLSSNETFVSPEIMPYILKSEDYDSPETLKKDIESTSVFACTSHGVSHKILPFITFDFCIIDEACQIFEPLLLGPLLFVDKFVLVGDPYQVSYK